MIYKSLIILVLALSISFGLGSIINVYSQAEEVEENYQEEINDSDEINEDTEEKTEKEEETQDYNDLENESKDIEEL